MSELSEHFVLFRTEGTIKATVVPSVPDAFTFGGKHFQRCERFIVDFNCLVRNGTLVGFHFPSAEEAGDAFLVSRFANASANAELSGNADVNRTSAELTIWLGEKAGAENDQSLCIATSMFESDEHEWDPLESTCRHASLSIL